VSTDSNNRFADCVALLIGGTQGLGLATARLLKAEGARGLLLAGRDRIKGEQVAIRLSDATCQVKYVKADLASTRDCAALVAAVKQEFGSCHAMINSAALTERGSVWNSDAELWDRMLHVNVRGPALVAQGIARLMAESKTAGSIVFIGSLSGYGGAPNLLPYSVSKGALMAMTRNLAFQLMRHRIRVNLLNPGWMDTPSEDLIQRRFEGATDGWLERAEANQPWGKLIKPDEIARTVVHLATAESGMLSGAIIDSISPTPRTQSRRRSRLHSCR